MARRPPEETIPASLESERTVLGAVLQYPSAWTVASETLTDEDFSRDDYRRLWAALSAFKERGEVPDRILLHAELARRGSLEAVGGLAGLLDLDQNLPENINVVGLCRVLKDKAALRALQRTAERSLEQIQSGHFSAEEIASGAAKEIGALQTGADDREDGRSPRTVIEQYEGGAAAFLDPAQRKQGIMTPFSRLNELTNGLHQGELIVLGARPGSGKSAIALNLLEHICIRAQERRFSALFSLEMNAASILTRLMCSLARVDAHRFRCGYLKREERYALQVALNDIVECQHLRIFDKFSMTIPEMCKHVKRMAKDEGLAVAVLDYLQLAAPSKKGENRNLEISEMTRQLKITAGDNHITWLALSQLSRRSEQRSGALQKPQLSDLRDGGSIEQDADSVWFIDREELRKPDRDDIKGLAELIISKQREGPIASVPLRFISGLVRFENRNDGIADDPPPPAPEPRSFQEPDGWG